MTVTLRPNFDNLKKIRKRITERTKLSVRNYKYAVIRCRNIITEWLVLGKTWKTSGLTYRWPSMGPAGKTIGQPWNLKYTGTFLRAMGEQPVMSFPELVFGTTINTGFVIDDQSIDQSIRKFNKRKNRNSQYWKIFGKSPGGGTKRSKTHYFVGASPTTFWGFMRKFNVKKSKSKNKDKIKILQSIPKNGRHVRTIGVVSKTLTEIRKNRKGFNDIVQKAVDDGIKGRIWPVERINTFAGSIGEPKMGNNYRRGALSEDKTCGKSSVNLAKLKRTLRDDKRAMMLEVLKASKRLG